MEENAINLISSENSNVRKKRGIFILRTISIVFLSFIAFLSILLFVINNKLSTENVKASQAQVLEKISSNSSKNAKYNLLSDRLRIIKSLLTSRRDYTKTLDALLRQLPPDVNIKGLTLDKEDAVMTVSSTSLLSINEFLNNAVKNLNNKALRDITIEGLIIDKSSGTFSLSLKASVI